MEEATISYKMKTGKGMIEGAMEVQDGYFEAVLAEMPTPLESFQPFFIAELQAEVKRKVVASVTPQANVEPVIPLTEFINNWIFHAATVMDVWQIMPSAF